MLTLLRLRALLARNTAAMRVRSLARVRVLYPRPEMAPRTVAAARAIVQKHFAQAERLNPAPDSTVFIQNVEYSFNGNTRKGLTVYDAEGMIHYEIEAAIRDEVINQQQRWRSRFAGTTLVYSSGANAAEINPKNFDISGFTVSSEDPTAAVVYSKYTGGAIDGLTKVVGGWEGLPGYRYNPGTGPVVITYRDLMAQTSIKAVHAFCSDFSLVTVPGGVARDVKAMFLQSNGSPLAILRKNPNAPVLTDTVRGMVVLSSDARDYEPEIESAHDVADSNGVYKIVDTTEVPKAKGAVATFVEEMVKGFEYFTKASSPQQEDVRASLTLAKKVGAKVEDINDLNGTADAYATPEFNLADLTDKDVATATDAVAEGSLFTVGLDLKPADRAVVPPEKDQVLFAGMDDDDDEPADGPVDPDDPDHPVDPQPDPIDPQPMPDPDKPVDPQPDPANPDQPVNPNNPVDPNNPVGPPVEPPVDPDQPVDPEHPVEPPVEPPIEPPVRPPLK